MTTKKIPEKKKETPQPTKKGHSSHYAVGRRKSSVARVYYFVSPNHEIVINAKPLNEYFPHITYQQIIQRPFIVTNRSKGKWKIMVLGGGKRGQAEAIRLGITRVLISLDKDLRPVLKQEGLVTRDPRVKERKKYGLKRARRAPQWQKR